jgi:hypothetical protein
MNVASCQPYALAAFTTRNYSWYSFLLEAEYDRKDYTNEKFQWHHRELNHIKSHTVNKD